MYIENVQKAKDRLNKELDFYQDRLLTTEKDLKYLQNKKSSENESYLVDILNDEIINKEGEIRFFLEEVNRLKIVLEITELKENTNIEIVDMHHANAYGKLFQMDNIGVIVEGEFGLDCVRWEDVDGYNLMN